MIATFRTEPERGVLDGPRWSVVMVDGRYGETFSSTLLRRAA